MRLDIYMQGTKDWAKRKIALLEQHATTAGTRLRGARRGGGRGVHDGCRKCASLRGDDDRKVDLLGLRLLLGCDCNGRRGHWRRRRCDRCLRSCGDCLSSGSAGDLDGRCDWSFIGHGFGALVWCTLNESFPLEVGGALGDEGLLELLAGCAAFEDLTLEVEAGESVVGPGRGVPVCAEWVEDPVEDAAYAALVDIEDVFDDVVQVSENVGNDACDRIPDTTSGLQRAGSGDGGSAGNDVPGLRALSESDEAASDSGCSWLGREGGSATA